MMCVCVLTISKEDGDMGRRSCFLSVLDFFFPNFACLFEEFLFDGFSEEGLVFEHSAGLLNDICEAEM